MHAIKQLLGVTSHIVLPLLQTEGETCLELQHSRACALSMK